MIGLEKGHVMLVAHQPAWITLANQTIECLRPLFPTDTIFEHIGSTSINTIKAKPIIDLAVGVDTLDEVENILVKLEEQGFLYQPTVGHDELMYFNKKNEKGFTTHHLHILPRLSQTFKNHLYFRDFLQSHPDIALQYEDLKISLSTRYINDRPSYTAGKETFIKQTVRKAQVAHFLGKTVTINIDRPIGSFHPKHPTIQYPINYGYIPGEIAPDNEELDVYLLDEQDTVKEYTGKIIAIIHRENDVEDKLIMAKNASYTRKDLQAMTYFQEQFYKSTIELYKKGE